MMRHSLKITRPLLAASALGLLLAASPSGAQDYDRYGDGYRSTEEVEVIAPPQYRQQRSSIGAPIRDVAISRAVRFDDLDLRTHDGARELRDRVRHTARELCKRLDRLYPITADGSPPCYSTAVHDAMEQADAAIDDARNFATNE